MASQHSHATQKAAPAALGEGLAGTPCCRSGLEEESWISEGQSQKALTPKVVGKPLMALWGGGEMNCGSGAPAAGLTEPRREGGRPFTGLCNRQQRLHDRWVAPDLPPEPLGEDGHPGEGLRVRREAPHWASTWCVCVCKRGESP